MTRAGVLSASNINGLHCQNAVTVAIGAKGLSGAVSSRVITSGSHCRPEAMGAGLVKRSAMLGKKLQQVAI